MTDHQVIDSLRNDGITSDSPGVLPIHRAGDIHSHQSWSMAEAKIPFSDEDTGPVDNTRAEDVIYSKFRKIF